MKVNPCPRHKSIHVKKDDIKERTRQLEAIRAKYPMQFPRSRDLNHLEQRDVLQSLGVMQRLYA